MLDDCGLDFDDARGALDSGLGQDVEAVHHLAEDIDLRLPAGGVADADRNRALIAGQAVQLVFVQTAAAVRPVDDLHLGGRSGDRPQNPVAPAPRLLVEAGVEQRSHGEGARSQQ